MVSHYMSFVDPWKGPFQVWNICASSYVLFDYHLYDESFQDTPPK